jgi:mono/diheme cytochrome c family protein
VRTLLKAVIVLEIGIVLTAVAGIGYLYARYPNVPEPENITVQATPERIARGEYLSHHVTGCVICHAERDMTKHGGPVKPGTLGAGGEFFGEESQGFAVYRTNITPAAIGNWTDGQLIRAITTGVTADNQPLVPIMPYPRFARLSREDIESIVAYIRTLKPVHASVPDRKLPFPLPLLVRTMPQAAALRPMPSKTDRVAYGEYLTNAAVCADCHTPSDDRANRSQAESSRADRSSSYRMVGGAPRKHHSRISYGHRYLERTAVSRQVQIVARNRAARPRENTVMPWQYYAGMTDEDLGAIYAYLRSLKPVVNRFQKFN